MKISEAIKYLTDKDFRQDARYMKALEEAKKKADKLHELTKHRYYVINWKGEPTVISRKQIDEWKAAKLLPKSYDFIRLQKYSLYFTK